MGWTAFHALFRRIRICAGMCAVVLVRVDRTRPGGRCVEGVEAKCTSRRRTLGKRSGHKQGRHGAQLWFERSVTTASIAVVRYAAAVNSAFFHAPSVELDHVFKVSGPSGVEAVEQEEKMSVLVCRSSATRAT